MITGNYGRPICRLDGLGIIINPSGDYNYDDNGTRLPFSPFQQALHDYLFYGRVYDPVSGSYTPPPMPVTISEPYQPGVTPTTWQGFLNAINQSDNFKRYLKVYTEFTRAYPKWMTDQLNDHNFFTLTGLMTKQSAYVKGIGQGSVTMSNRGDSILYFDVRDKDQSGTTNPSQHAILRYAALADGKLGVSRIFDAGDPSWMDFLIPLVALVSIGAFAAISAATYAGAAAGEAGATEASTAATASSVSSIVADPLTSASMFPYSSLTSILPSGSSIAAKIGSAGLSTLIGKAVSSISSPSTNTYHPAVQQSRTQPGYSVFTSPSSGINMNYLLLAGIIGVGFIIATKR